MDENWIGTYIIDEHGNVMPERDIVAWGNWMGSHFTQIALTRFAWGRVSTIFLGLDHSFLGGFAQSPLEYKPVLWETMIFGGALDRCQKRYRTREDALAGHYALVEECKQAAKNPDDQIAMETELKEVRLVHEGES